MHSRLRIAMSSRLATWKKHMDFCDRLIDHGKRCPACKKEKPCAVWDEMYKGFPEAEARTKILDNDKP